MKDAFPNTTIESTDKNSDVIIIELFRNFDIEMNETYP